MAGLAWVTGAGGLIGSHLVLSGPEFGAGWQVRGLCRSDLELTDFKAVAARFRAERPTLVIHCAALTKSPLCQAEPESAWRLNVEVTKHLANLAAAVQFIFFSTDLVFDGCKGQYIETDPPHPLSVYAETKAVAEQFILTNPNHTVVRTSLNAGVSPTGDRSLDEQLCQAWRRGEKVRLFTDEYRSPIPVEATARAVWELACQRLTGIFHIAGSERLSRWQIGQLVQARYPGLSGGMEPGSIRDYVGAPRPADTSLDCRKAQAKLSAPLPGLSQWSPGASAVQDCSSGLVQPRISGR